MQTQNHPQDGFTLVEVIVVAVIVAILSAVAVPIYLSYKTNSIENQANNIATSIGTFCHACGIGSGRCRIDEPATMESSGQMSCDANSTTITIPQQFRISLICEEVRVWSLAEVGISSLRVPLK